jgi:FxsC-like protein
MVARYVQHGDSDPGEPFVAEGLYSLMMVEGKHDDYLKAVAGIAREIVNASQAPYPAAERPGDLATGPNAFARPPRPRLRVIVLAPTTSRLPGERAPAPYGPSALDWDPYHASAGRPIADDLRTLAENLNFEPELIEFDDALDVLLEEDHPTAPAVLVVDVWAFDDADWRAWLRRFDRLSRPWISVLVVLNPRDAETDRYAEHLTLLLRDTLTRRNTGGRVASRLAARGAQSMEEFVRSFSAMAETAGVQYLMHSRGFRQREREVVGRGPDGHGGETSDESEA